MLHRWLLRLVLITLPLAALLWFWSGFWPTSTVPPLVRTSEVVVPPPSATPQTASTLLPTAIVVAPPTIIPRPVPGITVTNDTSPLTVTFQVESLLPNGAAEAFFWYDAPDGRKLRRILFSGDEQVRAAITITPSETGLTTTVPLSGSLDFWWAVRDRSGMLLRESGVVSLPTELAVLQRTEPISASERVDWIERSTPNLRIFVTPGSAGERDLGQIAEAAERAYAQAATWLTPTAAISVNVYLIPRVFWQGGVAYGNQLLIISYLDRNYVGIGLDSYLVHEITHALGAELLPEGAEVGGLLGEGIAVLAVGGHYGPEPTDAWAAIVADSERYVPLCRLRHDFYGAQHEVAYLQGASFSAYLLRTYGGDTFLELYRAQAPQRGEGSAEAVCAADQQDIAGSTGKTYAELERDWLAYLGTITPTAAQQRAWELQYRFFELMRRYQTERDPPARIIPPPPETWDAPTAADFLNSATGREAIILETMLGATLPAIQHGRIERATELLDAVEQALDTGALQTAAARDYAALVDATASIARALRLGDPDLLRATPIDPAILHLLPFTPRDLLYDLHMIPMRIEIDGDHATALIHITGDALNGRTLEQTPFHAEFARNGTTWHLTALREPES